MGRRRIDGLDDPLDPVAVTVEEIANGDRPVLIAMHEEGHGGWQLLDGDDVFERSPRVVPKADILKFSPGLAAVKRSSGGLASGSGFGSGALESFAHRMSPWTSPKMA